MPELLIDTDPISGMQSFIDVQPGDGTFRIVHKQDITPLIERNKRMQADPEVKRQGIKQGWQPVAHIPDVIVCRWLAEGIDVFNKDHMPLILRKLRDPDYRHLRTTLGAI